MLMLPVNLPVQKVESAQLAFALAVGLIYQGGGIITVAEAAQIAGMEERAFVEAAAALGEEMEEMVEQAYDAEHCAKALAEMEREGGKTFSLAEVCESLGIDPKIL
jgi:predicted HTH domain antitoxin